MEKLTGVLTFLALCELGWMLALWVTARKRAARCRQAEAALAMAYNHVCRLIGAADTLLHEGRFEQGTCCCGDSMEGHSDPMSSGHSPVDMGSYHAMRVFEDAVAPARAFLSKALPTWHHQKRGTDYHVLAEGIRFNTSRPASRPLHDGAEVVLYQDVATGRLSVREHAEFLDGRFLLLSRADGGCPECDADAATSMARQAL